MKIIIPTSTDGNSLEKDKRSFWLSVEITPVLGGSPVHWMDGPSFVAVVRGKHKGGTRPGYLSRNRGLGGRRQRFTDTVSLRRKDLDDYSLLTLVDLVSVQSVRRGTGSSTLCLWVHSLRGRWSGRRLDVQIYNPMSLIQTPSSKSCRSGESDSLKNMYCFKK